ncbi:nitrate reductase [Limnobacter litoralis]|uniref:Nitrate reductase subunit alpha n=1 Tax=Limnobacter litoralis TaxID=481366 RepID=A0ABQ5YPV5_9BURK|nr:molybdopterin-dependent oxidoreductase [Limnobacter litoralis]GLR26157.1 nitrate reductase subunit alpha [Limnobacter litoralis]
MNAPHSPQETRSTCPYCGVGCGVIIQTATEPSNEGRKRIIAVKGDPQHPANFGRLCSKGSKLAETANADLVLARATRPLMRTRRSDTVRPVSWSDALGHVADRFADLIQQHGPDSVAFYISGQLLTEDYYVFNKLAKGLIGTNNIDTNSRLCMSSAVSGYKRTLGADAPPCSYEDIEQADCTLIAGSNMAYAHPVAFRRLEAARQANPKHKLIVVDPRQTDTACLADLHLQIQPGTDVMLFNAMLKIMMDEGLLDAPYIHRFTEGFESMVQGLRPYTAALAASVCGVPESDIVMAARWFAQSEKTLSLYCQGLNQATTGTDKNTALIALHLATGHIGRPGCGPFSLTGQPNAMGGREVGGMATLLPAHRELSNPAHRQEVADFWGVTDISETPGASAVELFDRLEKGEIKAVWVACTNPAHSLPNSEKVARALRRAELVVVQDAYLSPATVQFADVVLPATTWGEKEGTVTNSERRISRVRVAATPPGEALHDWHIATEFGRLLEKRLQMRGLADRRRAPALGTLFPWGDPQAVFDEHRASTQGRDLDITGLTYTVLEEQGPQQWPMPEGAIMGKSRLYEEGQFPTRSGKAQFVFAEYTPVAEDADARFPWRLNTTRLRDQWHGGSRTGTLPELFSHEPEPALALNPRDAKRLNLQPNDWVHVKSRRSELLMRVRLDQGLGVNQCNIPMHWGPEYFAGLKGAGGVNALTLDDFDPYSKQPELKHCAVSVRKVKPDWHCVVFIQTPNWLGLWMKARALFNLFDSALCVPIGRERPGVLFRAIGLGKPGEQAVAALMDLFRFESAHVLHYSDPVTGSVRQIDLQPASQGAGWQLKGVMLLGQVQSEQWLRHWFDQGLDVTPVQRYLLSPLQSPPGEQAAPVRVVCNCMGVTDQAIESKLAELLPGDSNPEGRSVVELAQQLKTQLGCGSQCGSCMPEIGRLVSSGLATIKA